MLRLCLLGPPALATSTGLGPLDLRPKAVALLARLALVGGPQTRAELAELLFGQAERPRDSLRWYLSYLRARLPDGLIVENRAIPTDVELFRQGVERILRDAATPDGPATLTLYRGDLCAGLRVTAPADFHNWLYVEEDELRRLFRRATLALARQAIRDGRAAEAIPSLQQLTKVDPYSEDGHVLLVEASESAGDPVRARGAYDRYERIVRTELHAEPRRELAIRFEGREPGGPGLPLDGLVPLREITMHAIEWPGREPAILGVHGSAGHAYLFRTWGEALSPEIRVVAVDLRGHGLSDKPPSGYTVDDHVQDLLDLIAALALPRPILLGHSLGGSITTFVAEAAGDRIGGLVLLDAVVGDRAFIDTAAIVRRYFDPLLDERFASFEAYQAYWNTEDDSQWRRWLERSDRMDLAPLPDGTFRRRALREALAAEWASVAERDALEALSRVTVPVLVVHADAPFIDGRVYLDQATVEAQLAAARDALLCVSTGQHHSAVLRDPSESVLTAVRSFARDVGSRAA
jgi:pimeloyl-ACP methyl ester carboxylesterase/DNA-binding SARP family transcriptional activator